MGYFAIRMNTIRVSIVYSVRRRLTNMWSKKVFHRNVFSRRSAIAWTYINQKGNGVEIGAAANPIRFSAGTKVKYVDRLSREEKLVQEKASDPRAYRDMVRVDIIDDADKLETLADSSQDFVIANHVLEHCQSPITALKNMLRVLKTDGVLFLSVPDMRYTFDSTRQLTDLEHIIVDAVEGPERSFREHFKEWAKFVEKVPEDEIETRADKLINGRYGIHYHVWTQYALLELFLYLKKELAQAFEIECFCRNNTEVDIVLRKTS
jgi:SAM-dependent methyltransferase